MQLPLSSLQNLPHVPQLPPQHPHPATHYQPLNTKAFMKIGMIATVVAKQGELAFVDYKK